MSYLSVSFMGKEVDKAKKVIKESFEVLSDYFIAKKNYYKSYNKRKRFTRDKQIKKRTITFLSYWIFII